MGTMQFSTIPAGVYVADSDKMSGLLFVIRNIPSSNMSINGFKNSSNTCTK